VPEAVKQSEVDEAFEQELAQRNNTALRWAHLAFSAIFLLWWILDAFEAPEHAREFLVYRLTAVAVATIVVVIGGRTRVRATRSWLAMFAWFAIWGITVAAMLLKVSSHAALLYVVGLSVIGFGVAVLPFWPARWAIGGVLTLGAAGGCAMAFRPDPSLVDGLEAAFVYGTVGAGGAIIAVLKQRFFRGDFGRRMELKETSEQLSSALEQLKQIDREKTRLFHNVSHELRTPLTTILAPLDDIANGAPYRHDVFSMMRRSARRLLRLVDDILELSKLDEEGLPLHVEHIDLCEIVASVTTMLRPGARAREMELEFERPDSPLFAYVDPYRIETVLTNLIGNAIKYTPHGGSIEVRLDAQDDEVLIEVEDNGPGVSENMRDRIFDRYVQAGDKAMGGVGIGLSLARELVELHGGTIGVKSAKDKGSIFWFTLPPEHLRGEAAVQPKKWTQKKDTTRRLRTVTAETEIVNPDGTVLVVDDEPDLRALIAEVLGGCWSVIEAEDGVEAFRILQEEKPDVVVTDMTMPRMDGAALLREIRSTPSISHTPVIVLTAAGGAAWETAILASGADDYLSKPFSPEVLRARVRLQMRIRGLVAGLANREKLAAIGVLTAGILHEVNNPAGCIVAASSLIRPDVDAHKLQIAQDTIRDSAERIVKLTSALRSHARPDEHDTPRPFNLKEGIDSSMVLLSHKIKGRTDVEVHCPNELEAFGPAAAMNHVILNLVENASKSGASNVEVDARRLQSEEIEVIVQDDGPGVPEEQRERIFNPFFTTRDVGQGTGLGLFLCRKTLQEHGGSISLERSDIGARFVVRLKCPPKQEPVSMASLSAKKRPSVPPAA